MSIGPQGFTKPVLTLHQLEPDTLFRDKDSLWRVVEGGDSDNILAIRVAGWNVNNTGELMARQGGPENYNAYNEVHLVDGIYEVIR